MIELYVVVTLFAIGYLMNKKIPATETATNVNKSMMPSINNVYSSGYTGYADAMTQKRSHAMTKSRSTLLKQVLYLKTSSSIARTMGFVC